eukprot:m.107923 g.107923  ORF g.107923 m.107923 type:complete len:382 (-) comp16936_c0_seq2:59-1204(-)
MESDLNALSRNEVAYGSLEMPSSPKMQEKAGKWYRSGVNYDGSHISHYDERRVLRMPFWNFYGTVFDFWHGQFASWMQCFLLLATATVVAVVTVVDHGQDNSESVATWAYVKETGTVINSLVVFLLGFHTNDVKTRWWAMRDAVQQMQGGAVGVALQAATFFPEEAHFRVRKKLVQYAVCIHESVWIRAAKNVDKTRYVARRALTNTERDALQSHARPDQLLFYWIQSLSLSASKARPDVQHDVWMTCIQSAIQDMRRGASAIKTYQDTQLPFPYVHLLSLIVKLALFILALDTGGELAVAYQQHYITWMVLSTFKLLIMNFFYQGLLELQVIFTNPFLDHPAHFPQAMMQRQLESACANIVAQKYVDSVTFDDLVSTTMC